MDWLANLVTGGEHRRLGLNAKHLRAAYADSEDRVERLTEDLAAASNALAELGTERDGLLNQVDGMKANHAHAVRQRDAARARNERFAATLRRFETDRDLLLAHAVRLRGMDREYRVVLEAAVYALGVVTNEHVAQRGFWNRRHDAATVRAEAMRREVERQRGVIAALRAERDEDRQNAYDQPRDKKGRFTRNGAQKRKDQANGRRRK